MKLKAIDSLPRRLKPKGNKDFTRPVSNEDGIPRSLWHLTSDEIDEFIEILISNTSDDSPESERQLRAIKGFANRRGKHKRAKIVREEQEALAANPDYPPLTQNEREWLEKEEQTMPGEINHHVWTHRLTGVILILTGYWATTTDWNIPGLVPLCLFIAGIVLLNGLRGWVEDGWPRRHPEATRLQTKKRLCAEKLRERENDLRRKEEARRKREEDRRIEEARMNAEFWITLDWRELEHESARLFNSMGYHAEVGKGTNDKGVDVTALNANGATLIQCKQQASKVGRPVVQNLMGALSAENGFEAIVIAPNGFSGPAIEYAKTHNVILLDAAALADLKVKHKAS